MHSSVTKATNWDAGHLKEDPDGADLAPTVKKMTKFGNKGITNMGLPWQNWLESFDGKLDNISSSINRLVQHTVDTQKEFITSLKSLPIQHIPSTLPPMHIPSTLPLMHIPSTLLSTI